MTTYGHDLQFGSFLTPSAGTPDTVVALAQLSEQVGLDLVTFQDHPYQPAFLDTWTLLSYVAARTEVIRLAPNVLNLPLRLPAVIARSAASLDLLSGGRLELGIGAGAFWDAIEAMGGPRRSPGRGGRRARARRSRSSARSGTQSARGGVRVRRRALPGRAAPSAVRRRRTRSASGSARTSRGCSPWSAGWPTAGCRRWPTSAGSSGSRS